MRSWLTVTLACASLASISLAGCGQTGNLYLPDKDAEVVGTADPAVDAETADTSDESDGKRDKVPQPTPPAPQ